MGQGTINIDIKENRFGFRETVYRVGTRIIWRDLKSPGMKADLVPIDLAKYKKKVYTLTREGYKPVKRVILTL